MESISVFAPASIANLNSGFDVLGLALPEIGDTITIMPNGLNENRIVEIENGDNLPFKADKNCCTVSIQAMQDSMQSPIFVDVKIKKGTPAGSGLGSSSASCAGAVVAYHELIKAERNIHFSETDLVKFAGVGEAMASGAIHFDNVAPAVLGGFTLCSQSSTQPFIRLPVPSGLRILLVFPQVEIKTADARKVLPDTVALGVATKQMANIATTVHALYQNDVALLSESLVDLLATPTRKVLIPHFDNVHSLVKEAGGLAFGISGSGPTMFALFPENSELSTLSERIQSLYLADNLRCDTHNFSLSNSIGAHVIAKQ